jgi:hypothetical protein
MYFDNLKEMHPVVLAYINFFFCWLKHNTPEFRSRHQCERILMLIAICTYVYFGL